MITKKQADDLMDKLHELPLPKRNEQLFGIAYKYFKEGVREARKQILEEIDRNIEASINF